MDDEKRTKALSRIRENIKRFGHHVYSIEGGHVPRYMYTIGLSPVAGNELILAGAACYSTQEAKGILDGLAERRRECEGGALVRVEPFGDFQLRQAHASWTSLLARGASDYYNDSSVKTLQVLPVSGERWIDIPDLSSVFDVDREPIWRWLTASWTLGIPERSTATTNLAALSGEPVTEVVRWETDEWEMFAGSGEETKDEEIRILPIGVLIGADATLGVAASLSIGDGLWRDAQGGGWQAWERAGE